MRCECCNRWAPRARGTDGPAPGDCVGTAKIEEARSLAKIWRARALKAGWTKTPTKCGCGVEIASNRSECDACFNCESKDRTDGTTSQAIDLAAESTAEEEHRKRCPGAKLCPVCTPELFKSSVPLVHCSGRKRHSFTVDSPMHEHMLERGCFHCGAFEDRTGYVLKCR